MPIPRPELPRSTRNWPASGLTVAQMLKDAGIAANRISYSSTGGDRNVSATPESNRVAVCIVK